MFAGGKNDLIEVFDWNFLIAEQKFVCVIRKEK